MIEKQLRTSGRHQKWPVARWAYRIPTTIGEKRLISHKQYLLSWINLDMAAAGVAILDNPNLGGDALAHCVGMTDDPHLLALRTLQHGEGVDDGGEGIGVEGSEAFVDEQVLEGDVAGRQC